MGFLFLFHILSVGAFIPAPLRFRNYVRTSLRTPTIHYACIHAATSAPRGISSSFLTPHVPFFRPYPCHSPTHFQRLPSFLRRVSPNKKNPFLEFDKEWFLFQKDSKRQIQLGLFEYNIYRQKNKKSSKDKAANTDQRFGQ